ncbi:hypothetical protein MTO96_030706, partial [Rhipicephalus appendiculatus]
SNAATASHTASGLLVPRQHNSGKGLPDASSATSLPSVPRTSVASRSTTEVPMPGQIGSSAATASHTASGLIVPRQHNSGKGLPDASSATSLPSVPRTSVASRSTTEVPMPQQIVSQDLMLSSPAPVEPDEFASQDLLMCSSPIPAEPDEFGEAWTPLQSNEGLQTVIGSSRDDGKIYAGNDKWVEKEAWGTLFRASTDSLFCRMATMVYWTPDELKGLSVTGKLSNKSRSLGQTEAKPPLTPDKVASLKALFRIFMGGRTRRRAEKAPERPGFGKEMEAPSNHTSPDQMHRGSYGTAASAATLQ